MTIDWAAVDRALEYYQANKGEVLLYDWMLDNWGIKGGVDDFIEIVDEKKYTAFLLRFV